jgi:hypothetical protein
MSVKTLTAKGKTQTLREWSIATGIRKDTINIRLRRGWTPEQALGLVASPCNRPGPKTRHSFATGYQSRQMAERRRHARALNVCRECFSDKTEPARSKCQTCLQADAIRFQQRYHNQRAA